jgi:aryl sulfotransferase
MTAKSSRGATFVPIASYPKSGNTWVRAFLTAWFRGALGELDDLVAPPVLSLRRHFDDTTGVASADLTIEEIDRLRPGFHRALGAEMGAPCFVKLHDRWYRNDVGEPIFGRAACRGAIYIVRHPAAVAVSYAHHLRISIADAVSIMCDEAAAIAGRHDAIDPNLPQRLGGWSGHVASWLDQDELPTLAIRYEDILREPAEQFAKILAVAGIEPDRERIAQAVAASDFVRLRALEARGGFRERAGDHAFFRQGRSDGWRERLGPDLLERLVAVHGETMARLGYSTDATG